MASSSNIEWTDATWQPVTGCSIVSPGCTNCYAMRLAGTRLQHHPSRANLTTMSKAGPVWNGAVRFNEQWLTQPLGWKKPRRIFVCAHGDLFHGSIPDEWIDKVFAVMALTPHHTYQVLTKRSARMRAYMAGARERIVTRSTDGHENVGIQTAKVYRSTTKVGGSFEWPLPNVWLGVSTERQKETDERIPDLLATPAAVRFISAEPLLGPIDLEPWLEWKDQSIEVNGKAWGCQECDSDCPSCPKGKAHYHIEEGPPDKDGCPEWMTHNRVTLDWVIVGGESGPGARPMHPDWARSLRDQCAAAGVAFFFKQWGSWREPTDDNGPFDTAKGRMNRPPAFIVKPEDGTVHCFLPPGPNLRCRVMLEVGKKAAGRSLDGFEHNATPESVA